MSLTCPCCGLLYQYKQNLNRHMKSCHSSEAVGLIPVPSLLCTVCGNRYLQKKHFLQHLTDSHNIAISTATLNFDSLQEFHAWKTVIEKATRSSYVSAKGKRVNRGSQVLRLECSRSGYYTSEGKGLRRLKIQGSKKIGGYCPASLKVVVDKDGKCAVTYFSNHWGHSVDLQHLSLTADERNQLAAKVAAKIPPKEILNDVRRCVSNPTELTRLDLVTKKDLLNIKAGLNRSSGGAKHHSDAKSGNETQADGDDISCDKPQDQAHNVLLKVKQETLALMRTITAQIENSTSVEGIEAAKNIASLILPKMHAAEESSGKDIKSTLQDTSNKRKIKPKLRFDSTKKVKI